MTIDPVATTAAQAVAGTAPAKPAVTQDEFLKLFVAQLQHQDPLSPLEPNELTAQLAQFSSLEQLTAINSRLDGLAGSARQANGSALLGLIGKDVLIDGSRMVVTGGTAPEVSYELSDAATAVTATVRDAGGNVVRTVDIGAQAKGTHTFEFDGKTSDGRALADGTYRLEITAAAKGAKVATPVALTTRAQIDGVDLASDPPALLAGSLRIDLDQIREVHSANDRP